MHDIFKSNIYLAFGINKIRKKIKTEELSQFCDMISQLIMKGHSEVGTPIVSNMAILPSQCIIAHQKATAARLQSLCFFVLLQTKKKNSF